MTRLSDILITALAPSIWGSTYIVTQELLPQGYPLTVAALRALPAGLLLLLIVRQFPARAWLGRVFLLGAFNFAIFFSLLFVAAYRLPGGVAATLGATQPLIVILLARTALGAPIRLLAVIAATAGVIGVAMLVLEPNARLDSIGVAAGIGGAASMAAGTVFSRKWAPPVSALTFTAWQLTAGGLLLAPLALALEPALPPLELRHVGGLVYLSLIGAAATYAIWFRGIARIEPAAVSMLAMMSPVVAVIIGVLLMSETLSAQQAIGMVIVFAAVWAGQSGALRARPTTTRPSPAFRASP